jgi:hypothetical protein
MATLNKSTHSRNDVQNLLNFVSSLSSEERRMLSKLLSKGQNQEYRKHPRTRCSIITQYIFNDQTYKATMKNISLGGAYIESQHVLPVSQQIMQSFFVPNFEIPIRSKSKIIWIESQGFGVQFDIIPNDKF